MRPMRAQMRSLHCFKITLIQKLKLKRCFSRCFFFETTVIEITSRDDAAVAGGHRQIHYEHLHLVWSTLQPSTVHRYG